MIFGVTHNAEGEPIKRLTVAYKLGHGVGPSEEKNYPGQRKEMFVSQRTSAAGKFGGTFVEDVEFTKLLKDTYAGGGPLKECDIILLSEDPEEIFRTQLALREQKRANALMCKGDGKSASRRWSMFTEKEQLEYRKAYDIAGPIDPKTFVDLDYCGDVCPYRQNRTCKPSGDLYFMFPERVQHGSVATLHTSGHESVKRIVSSLHAIKNEIEPYGGSLKMLRVKIVLRAYRVTYQDKDGQKTGSQLAYNLEFREQDYRKLIPKMIEASRQFTEDMSDVIDVPIEEISDEEIATEFHPTPEQQEAQRRDEAQAEQRAPSTRPAALNKVVDARKPKQETAPPTIAETFDGKRDEPSPVNDDDVI